MKKEQIGTYLWVEPLVNDGWKTEQWKVWGRHESYLGVISWFGSWRGYVYHPSACLLSAGCMKDLASFLSTATKEHLQRKRVGG